MDKNKAIQNVYYDLAGFSSIKTTLKDVQKQNPAITYTDVKQWIEKNVPRKTQLRGYNSFIPKEPLQEFQIDLFFMPDVKDEFIGGLLMIDIFTKFITVIPIKTRQVPEILEAIKEGIKKMGKPKTIYSDDEGAFRSHEAQDYFKDNDISHIITRTHANVAERAIRTIKSMIYNRLEKHGKNWSSYLYPVLLVYNNKNEHRSIGMTPNEARKPKNELQVRLSLELARKKNRIYPDIVVGDKVRIYQKKDKLAKERKSLWSENAYEVERIEEVNGQSFYKVSGRDRMLLRHEILKLP